jgi:hypothetical protein
MKLLQGLPTGNSPFVTSLSLQPGPSCGDPPKRLNEERDSVWPSHTVRCGAAQWAELVVPVWPHEPFLWNEILTYEHTTRITALLLAGRAALICLRVFPPERRPWKRTPARQVQTFSTEAKWTLAAPKRRT